MDKHPINDFAENTIQKIRDMIDVNTIIGTPVTTPDGIMVIPVSKVSLGFISGGADWSKAHVPSNFSAGVTTGVTMTPIGFLIIKDGNVRMMPISKPADGTLDRLIEAAPDLIDKVSDIFGKDKDIV
ncbi:MAG: GerW family sporulation protein [Oscillospiraceae bacterium]|nr:GerW family sporulation protein [Oscillospiraceae bacterium]